MNSKTKYYPTIGIETHVQLRTQTKLFAAVGNDARQTPPNTLISHICVGMPGALPVLNEKAIELTARAAFALNTKPQKFSKFDRKHYFYPDLPKGYQITQYDQPLIVGGHVDITVSGENKRIGITRAHLEEDAGKNTHPEGADYSLVDLNRAGTPLIEIVSEPDIHSAAEAKAYARELWLTMEYADVTDGDLYHGHVRFDVNVSISKDQDKLGTRSEIKNLNSFRAVENAVAYEIKRQIGLIEKGEKIVQETRGWDEAKQKTISQREKEEAHDYRYMPEPDIPPIELDEKYIDDIGKTMPRLPNEWRKILNKLSIPTESAELLLEAEMESEDLTFLPLLEQNKGDEKMIKFLVNWQVNVFIPLVREGRIKSEKSRDLGLEASIFRLLNDNKLNSTNAKKLFEELLSLPALPENVEEYAQDKGFIQISDKAEIEKIVVEAMRENPKVVADIKAGEEKAIGFIVGQVMQKSRGKADPKLAQELIRKHLNLM